MQVSTTFLLYRWRTQPKVVHTNLLSKYNRNNTSFQSTYVQRLCNKCNSILKSPAKSLCKVQNNTLSTVFVIRSVTSKERSVTCTSFNVGKLTSSLGHGTNPSFLVTFLIMKTVGLHTTETFYYARQDHYLDSFWRIISGYHLLHKV